MACDPCEYQFLDCSVACVGSAIASPEDDLKDKRVLEIGCGLGRFAVWLATQPNRPREIFAGDFSPVAVDNGRKLPIEAGSQAIEWFVGDIESLEFEDNSFDTVFSFETIEHVPNPPRAVQELARVLKPGGRLYLTTPNYLGTFGLYRTYCYLRGRKFDEGGQPICHLTLLPKTRRWVQMANLRIVKSRTTGHYLPLPGRTPMDLKWLSRLGILSTPLVFIPWSLELNSRNVCSIHPFRKMVGRIRRSDNPNDGS